MATSGTTTFNLDFGDIIEEAFERAGVSMRGGYSYKTAKRSLGLLLTEWSNRGINLWTLEEQSLTLLSGTGTYTLPADTIDVLEAVIRNNNSDYTVTRISVSTFSSIPNKTQTGQPSQYYINRLRDAPTITLYPRPGDTLNNQTLVYWRLRQMQDVGDNPEINQDVPIRFLPALVAGLAYQIAMKFPEGAKKVPFLKAEYDIQFRLAEEEDRERAQWSIVPSWDDYRI